jgi:hypothetical protein
MLELEIARYFVAGFSTLQEKKIHLQKKRASLRFVSRTGRD